jgi:hypothetical protein
VHQTARQTASTFWSGCGAIRRSVFLEMSGFDQETYRRPAIEDIELGYRLTSAGHRIELDRDLVVKHLKKWTFWGLLKTDILDRGIPWTELILRDSNMPDDLNVQLSQRVSVALVFLLVLSSALVAVYWRGYVLAPIFAVVLVLLSRYWVDAALTRNRFAMAAMTLSILALVLMSVAYHMLALVPPVVLAYTVLFLKHRYTRDGSKRGRLLAFLVAVYGGLAVVSAILYLPRNLLLGGLFALALVIVVLNSTFYVFLAEKRGRSFALAAIPFHLLYHLYNGISFTAGVVRHFWRVLIKTPSTGALETRERDS